jgi:tryptophan synthase alpha chain
MSRIAQRFEQIRAAGRAALIPYVTAGDPHPDHTVPLLHALVAAGADLLEIGVPFSDPMADGPVIQQACERALAQGTRLRDVLDMVQTFRARDTETPVILMGYLNPIERMGILPFVTRAAAAGVDGILVVDLPPEESQELSDTLLQQQMDLIFLLAPTTTPERLQQVVAAARGFLYYVSLKGVTGAQSLDTRSLAPRLADIRAHTLLPVGVGFGIRDAVTAAQVAQVADAVVVGSAFVRLSERFPEDPAGLLAAAADLARAMRTAMDAARTMTSCTQGQDHELV